MIDEAKDLLEKATVVEEKVSFLTKIPWWVYIAVIAGGWYLIKGPANKDESEAD